MIALAATPDVLVVLAGWAVLGAVWVSSLRRPSPMHRHQRAMTALDRASKGDKR